MTGYVPIVALGDFQGSLQGLLHLGAEPMLYAVGDESRSDEKEKDRRHQGKTDKGHDQFDSEFCPEDLALSLKDELDEVTDHEEDQEEDEDDVDIDQAEDDDVIADREAFPPLEGISAPGWSAER